MRPCRRDPPTRIRCASAATLCGELVDALGDVPTKTVCVRILGTYVYEPGSIEHLCRTDVVLGDASKERSRRLDGEERSKRSRSKALAPTRRIDPVRNLAVAIDGEAGDCADRRPFSSTASRTFDASFLTFG